MQGAGQLYKAGTAKAAVKRLAQREAGGLVIRESSLRRNGAAGLYAEGQRLFARRDACVQQDAVQRKRCLAFGGA